MKNLLGLFNLSFGESKKLLIIYPAEEDNAVAKTINKKLISKKEFQD